MTRQINAEIKHTHCEFNETRKQKNANQMRAHKIWNARPEKWWNLWILYCQCVRHFHSNLFALKMVDSAKCLWKQSKMTTIIAAFSINACKASLYPNKSTQKLIIYYSGFLFFFCCYAMRSESRRGKIAALATIVFVIVSIILTSFWKCVDACGGGWRGSNAEKIDARKCERYQRKNNKTIWHK